jgi:hypothetical protein
MPIDLTVYQRFEILSKRATRQIDEERRRYLLALAEEAIGPLVLEGRIKDAEELFYLYAANAMATMLNYIEDLQARVGAEMMRKEGL